MTSVLLFLFLAAPQQADSKVREAIGTLEKALVSKDESLADLFDVSRLVREMEVHGSIPDEGGFRYRSARRLEDNLASIAYAPGALGGGWGRISPLSVRLNPAGDEAEALCRVMIGGKKTKFRVWLIRNGDSWRTFDLENLDGTYRLSVIGLQYTPGVHDDDDRNALRDGVMSLQRGSVYLTKGKAEGAREAFAMARRSGPPDYVMDWIDVVDGQAMSALGDPAGALKTADRVLARQKDLAAALRLKAACHLELGDPAKAILAGKAYLKLVGDEAETGTLVGKACERLDRKDEAIDAYRKAAEADPEDVGSRRELGRVLLELRRPAEAGAAFAAAVRLDPDVFEDAADLLDRAGASAEALALADEESARQPDAATVLSRRGRALRTLGRLKEADELLRRAAAKHPGDAELAREFVLVLAQSGKDAEAKERMRSAETWQDAYVRAFVHAAAGRTPQALEELKTVLRAEDALSTSLAWIEKEPVFRELRGGALLDPARAARDYRIARKSPSLSPEQRLRLAQERIAAAPDHALAYYDQGQALRQLRRGAEAETSIRKALELGKDPAYPIELGRTLAAQGKLEEALAVADGMIPTAEQSGLDLRVAVYAIAGKRDAALKALQSMLDKHPDWYASVTPGADLDEFRRLPSVQEQIRKARAKVEK